LNSLILGAVFSAAVLNSLAPGPSMFLVLARASTAGLTAGFFAMAGVLSAQLFYLAVAGAVLIYAIPMSEPILTGLRLFGAVLLVYMAWCLIAKPCGDPEGPQADVVLHDYVHGVIVGVANPFNLVFMFGLLPQVVPAQGLAILDVVWISVTVLGASALPKIGLVVIASRIRRSTGITTPWVSRAAGLVLLAYAAMAVVGSVTA
jgi:threonine/homoserine/homoserine lactone efflux protein